MPADDPMYARAVELLERFGAVSVEHPSGTLLEHLRGTYEQLDRWGCSKDLCLAGLYHSVYGTEKFRKQTVPLEARDAVRGAIGKQAEEIAYLYCALSRESLYRNLDVGAPYGVKTQDSGEGAAQSGAARRPDDPGPREPTRAAATDEAKFCADRTRSNGLRASRATTSRRRRRGVSGHLSPSQQGGDVRAKNSEPAATSGSFNHEAVETELTGLGNAHSAITSGASVLGGSAKNSASGASPISRRPNRQSHPQPHCHG